MTSQTSSSGVMASTQNNVNGDAVGGTSRTSEFPSSSDASSVLNGEGHHDAVVSSSSGNGQRESGEEGLSNQSASEQEYFNLKEYLSYQEKRNGSSLNHNLLNDIKILKVNQLDSDRLDFEIENYLKSYFKRVFKHFNSVENYEPEIMLFIRIFIYKYSIFDNNQSFGDGIQNLKYNTINLKNPSTISKAIYGLACIGIPYLFERLSKRESFNYLKKYEYYYKLLEFINFVIFLYQGKYKSVIDRVFNWRKVYATRFMIRQLSFDYMNTELIWNGLAETILFIAPLINFKKLFTFLYRKFYLTIKSQIFRLGETSTPNSTASIIAKNLTSQDRVDVDKLNDECPYCNSNPILIPFTSHDGDCKHRFCYYCIQSALLNDSSEHIVNCPICSKEISQIKRWK